ncbi:NAD(P)/FAD-dependent oxidoreductase [Agromyces sp. NPDC058484]|uniref:NAD(P)/FAD-dependent oxidoreductase n=1 Tax=Agromyces sp. NPDC058484 TaxID=3346524 RepID=UPI0036584CE7
MQRPTSFEMAEAAADIREIRSRLADAAHTPFWLDDRGFPADSPALSCDTVTDLVVVGGGYNGLWTALRAKERYPEQDVVLIEAKRIGWAASGRNGGFCEPSLTHGSANAKIHVPGEERLLKRLGEQNLEELLETIERYDIDCDVRPHGVIKLATEPHQERSLRELAESDESVILLEGEKLQEQVRTAAARVGGWATKEGVVLHPVKLAEGLVRACEELGVRIHEHTPALRVRSSGRGAGVVVETPGGRISARRAALATNGFPSLLRRSRLFTVPVYDYAIVTEPLTVEQRESLGWATEQGVADLNNRFHYMRLLQDREGRSRLLLGGYDAIYYFGRKVKPEYDVSESSFERLAIHMGVIFPQLAGIHYTHAWGGMIDTCSRFFSFFTQAGHGQIATSAGFTGLGVAATRFSADVVLDLLNGEDSERVRTKLVRRRPTPFPPEPFVWPAISFTSAMMARSDRREGKQGFWLWLLEKCRLGFDS